MKNTCVKKKKFNNPFKPEIWNANLWRKAKNAVEFTV